MPTSSLSQYYGMDVHEALEKQLAEEISKSINAQILNKISFDILKIEFQKVRRDKTIDQLTGGDYIDNSGIIDIIMKDNPFNIDEGYLREQLIIFIENGEDIDFNLTPFK